MSNCKVIALTNQKGRKLPVAIVLRRPKKQLRSVGNTTTAVDLGVCLVKQGKRCC